MVAAPVLWSSAGVVTRHIQNAEPFEQVFWRSLFAFAFVFDRSAFPEQAPVDRGARRRLARPRLRPDVGDHVHRLPVRAVDDHHRERAGGDEREPAPHRALCEAVPERSGAAPHLARGRRRRGRHRLDVQLRPLGALRRDGDRLHDPGRGGDQRGRPARERREARSRAGRDARRRALVPDRPALCVAYFCDWKRCRAAGVSRHHPARAAVHAAGARQPRAARAGDRAARPAGSGARAAVGVARRGRGTRRCDAGRRRDRARRPGRQRAGGHADEGSYVSAGRP